MITNSRSLACALFLLSLPLPSAGAAARPPVAILYRISGEGLGTVPGHTPEPLRLFDRLSAGAVLDLRPGSGLSLAFVNGRRYEISGPARVTLGQEDLAARSGGVRALPPVPPLPRLAAIAEDERPGPKSGALRIRSEAISGLSPDRGAVCLASAARLRFDPVTATQTYRVEIADASGELVWSAHTGTTEIAVPSGTLAPGRTYLWTVETVDRPGAAARGEAFLTTLDAGRAQARERLARWAWSSGEADGPSLLAGVDQALGLGAAVPELERPSVPGVPKVGPRASSARTKLIPGNGLSTYYRRATGLLSPVSSPLRRLTPARRQERCRDDFST